MKDAAMNITNTRNESTQNESDILLINTKYLRIRNGLNRPGKAFKKLIPFINFLK